MAREIEITEEDLTAMQQKLQEERSTMSDEDVALLEALVAKAQAERGVRPSEAGWYFRWTYRF